VSRLTELSVSDLGIIDDLSLLLEGGMTALTGETGAGKTMVVGAIDLLLGGRSDAAMVRPGAKEAVVAGRFVRGDREMVITRVVPTSGRSRAYLDGQMTTAATLAETMAEMVDIHGQHAHQSLLRPAVQRAALDQFGGVDLTELSDARAAVADIRGRLDQMGGDPGARSRELDLLRFQVDELDAADLTDPDEDRALDVEEDRLSDAVAHREAAGSAHQSLSGEAGAVDTLAQALAAISGRQPFADQAKRITDLHAELVDVTAELRTAGDLVEEDPARLSEIRNRRQLLVELVRKYGGAPLGGGRSGGGTLADVIAYLDTARSRLSELESHDARASELDLRLQAAQTRVAAAAATVARRRRDAAPRLAGAVEQHLAELAMAKARIEITVGEEDPGDEVTVLLAANAGLPAGPLSRVASGGELARTMLALRLVVAGAPPILVFVDVDAGIGGDAAVSVGRALGALGEEHQVLVVTHLPQVAAFAGQQVLVSKEDKGEISTMRARSLDREQRIDEIARMLAGSNSGGSVRDAARELLDRSLAEPR